MIWLILLIAIIISLVMSLTTRPEVIDFKSKKILKPYTKSVIEVELVGVQNRIEAKQGLNLNSELDVKFEVKNPRDKNALAVLRRDNGELIGYIPRNQRKLVKTLRENPNCLAILKAKGWRYGGGDTHGNRWGVVELFVGYSTEELVEIRRQKGLLE